MGAVRAGFGLPSRLQHAAASSPGRHRGAGPGREYGVSTISKLDLISLALALVLGTAGLPHVLMRFYTVPNAKEARRSVVWAIWLVGPFYLFTLVLGYGAMRLVGPNRILAAPGGRTPPPPCWPTSWAGRCFSASWRRWRSRPSWRSSQA